jgi:hypothetical protein
LIFIRAHNQLDSRGFRAPAFFVGGAQKFAWLANFFEDTLISA